MERPEWLTIESNETSITFSCKVNTDLTERGANVLITPNHGDGSETVEVRQWPGEYTGNTIVFKVSVSNEDTVSVAGGTIGLFLKESVESVIGESVEFDDETRKITLTISEQKKDFTITVVTKKTLLIERIKWNMPITDEGVILGLNNGDLPIISNADAKLGEQTVNQVIKNGTSLSFMIEKMKVNISDFTIKFPDDSMTRLQLALYFSDPISLYNYTGKTSDVRLSTNKQIIYINGDDKTGEDQELSFSVKYDVGTRFDKFGCDIAGQIEREEILEKLYVSFSYLGDLLVSHEIDLRTTETSPTDQTTEGHEEDTGDTTPKTYNINLSSSYESTSWKKAPILLEEDFGFEVYIGQDVIQNTALLNLESGNYHLTGDYTAEEYIAAISALKSTPTSKFATISSLLKGNDVTMAIQAQREWEQAHMEVPTPQEASGTTVNP